MADRATLMAEALAAFQDGRRHVAEAKLRLVIQADPRDVDAHVALGMVAAAAGETSVAIERMGEALRVRPGFVPALEWLTVLHMRDGNLVDAAKFGEQGHRAAPGNVHFLKVLGQCAAELGDLAEALRLFERALEIEPLDAQVLFARGTILRGLGREGEALAALEKSVELVAVPGSLIELAEIQILLGRASEGLATCGRVAPGSYRFHLAMARALTELGRLEEAQGHWREVEGLEPSVGDGALEKSFSFAWIGRFEEALGDVHRAIERRPLWGKPYFVLFSARRVTDVDVPLIERVEGLSRDPSVGDADRRDMFYALGKAYDDLGRYEEAIDRFDRANALVMRPPFDRESFRRFIDRQIETYPGSAAVEGSYLPLFVVGMMRSGTTLVEQILSCHPEVGSAGEQGFWVDHEAVDDRTREGLRAEYLRILSTIAPGFARVTDKNPANVLVAGLLHAVFPSSRIICTRRNAVDTALSIWMTQMRTSAPFVSDRSDIVFAYKECLRLMGHWRVSMPGSRYMEVGYESLTAEPEATIRGMVDFCGLEWDAGCLHPEVGARVVKTPSFWQVRQPLYRSSVDRWRRYERWLGPFEELIGL